MTFNFVDIIYQNTVKYHPLVCKSLGSYIYGAKNN